MGSLCCGCCKEPEVEETAQSQQTQENLQQPEFPSLSKTDQPSDTVLGKEFEDVHNYYKLGNELGRGQFAITYLCTEKATRQSYACKSISKHKLVHKNDWENVKREIQIMKHLKGVSNVVEFKGAYEDKQSVHIIMELCAGGELFDHIIAKPHYSECTAANFCREIVCGIHACHSMGVMHRDIKPENFLLAEKVEGAKLKAIDFGLSVFVEEGQVYTDIVGSAYYVAPEVLRGRYGKEIDIWSAGVILYILLSGLVPFWAETDEGIFKAIQQHDIEFETAPWPSISDSAKDLVRKMLAQDPKKRITSVQVLEHPWIKEGGRVSDEPLHSVVLSRMKQFQAMNKLKKLALKVIAENLFEVEIKGLKQMFANMHAKNNGTITYNELKAGLGRLGSKLSDAEIKQLMDAADMDGKGTFDFNGFFTAIIHRHRLDREDNLCRAFHYFDKNKSGFLAKTELEKAMKTHGFSDSATMNEIFSQVDKDNDGRINYEEFCAMLKIGHHELAKKI